MKRGECVALRHKCLQRVLCPCTQHGWRLWPICVLMTEQTLKFKPLSNEIFEEKCQKDVRSGPNLSDAKVELTHSIRMEIQEEKSE